MGIVNKATGFEFGFNHFRAGNGISSYFAGTDTYGRFVNAQEYALNKSLYRNPSQPPWTIS